MRKLFIMAAILGALLLSSVSALAAYRFGIRHALETAIVWTDVPSVYIEVDGEVWEHIAE